MTDRIFETYAPAYWAASLPVIPLRQCNKMPDINQWSLYGRQMPTELEQQHWLASYPKGNIGLPLGPCSGICIIDIDTEDAELDKAIRDICGPTPWVRVGKKGAALAYRFEGQKNFKLRGADGGMMCEFLGLGNQVVLPPSIHPDTGLPYLASANLCEVKDQLPCLGTGIEDKLRGLLNAAGFAASSGARAKPLDIVAAGERDIQLVKLAGYLARVVLGIDMDNRSSLADAIQHVHTWVTDFTAKRAGDSIDPAKGVEKLLEFIVKDVEKGRTLPDGWDDALPAEWEEHPAIVVLRSSNNARRWDLKRMVFTLSDRVGESTDEFEIEEHVKSVLTEAATDPNASEYDLRRFRERVVSNYKLKLNWSDVQQLVRDHRQGQDSEDWADHEKVARSVLADLETLGELRFDNGRFWRWSGSCFVELDEASLYMHVATTVKDTTLGRWLEFLHDCWGDEQDFADLHDTLQEMFAATLFRIAPRYQRAFLLFGRAHTGKTQVINVLRALLPPQGIASLGPQKWDERFTLVDLVGKAANICGELPENSRIAGYTFKEVVEGSPVRSEYKGEDGFTFSPQCAHWFASNYLPISQDWTNGFMRRWLILDFNHKVPPGDRIENLAEGIVAEEREAIAAWAVQGLPRLLAQRGYTEPASHMKRLGQVRRINNSVLAFLEDTAMVTNGDGEVKLRDLHGIYMSHAQNIDRVPPVSLNRFAQMLEDLDYVVEERRDLTGTLVRSVRGLGWAEKRAA